MGNYTSHSRKRDMFAQLYCLGDIHPKAGAVLHKIDVMGCSSTNLCCLSTFQQTTDRWF
jgi:hypothetical protein